MSQLKHYVNFINKHRKLYERVGMGDVWKVLKICELSKNITSDHKSQIAQARSYYFLFIFVYTQHYSVAVSIATLILYSIIVTDQSEM